MENEQLIWQALLTKEIWMCSMVLLMGASHDGSAVCCVGMWNRGVWAVDKLVVWCVCV